MYETIAIIGGTGDLGFGLALRWARAGVPIVIGSRDEQKAKDAALRVTESLSPDPSRPVNVSVSGFENAAACAQARIVVMAVPFPAQAGTLKSIRGSLRNAILVDTTVPLAATVGGKATRVLSVWQGSAAAQAREMAPQGTQVLAAFHNVSAEVLGDLSAVPDCDVLVCGDDPAAKETLFPYIKLIFGLRPIDAGPLEMARIVETLTALLISVNQRHGIKHSGIRITGLSHS
jgi:8-hydroxy-5-deazaflavin:NADPH oxidoreductase